MLTHGVMAVSSAGAIALGLAGPPPSRRPIRWGLAFTLGWLAFSGLGLLASSLVGAPYGWIFLAIFVGVPAACLMLRCVWPVSWDGRRDLVPLGGLVVASLLPVSLITWLHRGGSYTTVQDKVKLAELALTLGVATLVSLAGREFDALADKEHRVLRSRGSLTLHTHDELAATAQRVWFRVLGLGGPFVVNAVLTLGIVVGLDADKKCTAGTPSGFGVGLTAATMLPVALTLVARQVAAPPRASHQRERVTTPWLVFGLIMLASVILATSPHLVAHRYHIPVFAAMAGIGFGYLAARIMQFHVVKEDLLESSVRTQIVCYAMGAACASAMFWLFAVGIWRPVGPAKAPTAAAVGWLVLLTVAASVACATSAMARARATRRLSLYPPVQNATGDLLPALFVGITLIACVGYVARSSARCHNPNIALIAGLIAAVAASAGLYGVIWKWLGEDYRRKLNAPTPYMFDERWVDDGYSNYRRQLKSLRVHELVELTILGALVAGAFMWVVVTAITQAPPF